MMKPVEFSIELIVKNGARKGLIIAIPRLPFLIGTDQECQLRPSSDAVGQRHCVFQTGTGGLVLVDLASPTGTWVDGSRIERPTPVGDGDEIRIGPLVFELHVRSARHASQATTSGA